MVTGSPIFKKCPTVVVTKPVLPIDVTLIVHPVPVPDTAVVAVPVDVA